MPKNVPKSLARFSNDSGRWGRNSPSQLLSFEVVEARDRHLSPAKPGKRPPAYSMPLGRRNLPETLVINDVVWRLIRTHERDFWAVTGFYQNDAGGRTVLKMGRAEDFMGVPMEWIGRWLCNREVRLYQQLADLTNVPKILGRVGTTGFVHAYATGEPLSRDRKIPDGFFNALSWRWCASLRSRGLAYVDANKPQNILLATTARPHLIDFQISYDVTSSGTIYSRAGSSIACAGADIYHILEHKKRMRPDEIGAGLAAGERAARSFTFIVLSPSRTSNSAAQPSSTARDGKITAGGKQVRGRANVSG